MKRRQMHTWFKEQIGLSRRNEAKNNPSTTFFFAEQLPPGWYIRLIYFYKKNPCMVYCSRSAMCLMTRRCSGKQWDAVVCRCFPTAGKVAGMPATPARARDGNEDIRLMLKRIHAGEPLLDEDAASTWAVRVLTERTIPIQIAVDPTAATPGQVRHGGVGMCAIWKCSQEVPGSRPVLGYTWFVCDDIHTNTCLHRQHTLKA